MPGQWRLPGHSTDPPDGAAAGCSDADITAYRPAAANGLSARERCVCVCVLLWYCCGLSCCCAAVLLCVVVCTKPPLSALKPPPRRCRRELPSYRAAGLCV